MLDYAFADLSLFLSPRSIAVVGATPDVNKAGGRVLINLQKSHYQGNLYPVNPKYKEIFGIKTFADLYSIPGDIDAVVISLPEALVLDILNQCPQKKVKFVIILGSEFAEQKGPQTAFQQALKTFAEQSGIRIYGPNSPGFFNLTERIEVSLSPFYEPHHFQSGGVALITQGVGLGRAVLDAGDRGIGFSYWVSTGNEADLEVADFIHHFSNDPAVRVILMILRELKDGRKFRRAAEAAREAGKPLIVLKIGESDLYSSAFKQAGVIQVHDLDELMDVAWLFSAYGMYTGNRIGIFSYSMEIGDLLADRCKEYQLDIPDIGNETKNFIQGLVPDAGAVENPMRWTAHLYQNPELFPNCLKRFAEDPMLDIVIVPFAPILGAYSEIIARHTVSIAKQTKKPIIPIWTTCSGEGGLEFEILAESRLPFYRSAQSCMEAIKRFTDFHLHPSGGAKSKQHHLLLSSMNVEGRLTEDQSKQLLRQFGIAVDRDAGKEWWALAQHPVVEMVAGIRTDPVFGATIMVGAGGMPGRMFSDRSFRVVPLSERDAIKMIEELRCYSYLNGEKGEAAMDIEALKELLLNLSDLAAVFAGSVKEVEVGPIYLYKKGNGLCVGNGQVLFEHPEIEDIKIKSSKSG